jgi:hypothetical protein
MQLSQDEQDLARWLYLVAGFSRSHVARDFETTTEEIEQVVSTGLAGVLKSSSTKPKRKPHKSAFQADSPQPQTEAPKLDLELARVVFTRAFDES